MTNPTVEHQKRLLTRARVRASAAVDVVDPVAYGDERAAEDLPVHEAVEGIAEGMRPYAAAPTPEEMPSSPGMRTFFWTGVLGAAFAAAVAQAPHGSQWSPTVVVVGFLVAGGLVWLIRYGIFAFRRHGRHDRGATATGSPGRRAAHLALPGQGSVPTDLSAELRALERSASASRAEHDKSDAALLDQINDLKAELRALEGPASVTRAEHDPSEAALLGGTIDLDAELRALEASAGTVRAESDPSDAAAPGPATVVHRPAPACPDCIATAWLDHRQPPGMVGLIIVHELSCPNYARATGTGSQPG